MNGWIQKRMTCNDGIDRYITTMITDQSSRFYPSPSLPSIYNVSKKYAWKKRYVRSKGCLASIPCHVLTTTTTTYSVALVVVVVLMMMMVQDNRYRPRQAGITRITKLRYPIHHDKTKRKWKIGWVIKMPLTKEGINQFRVEERGQIFCLRVSVSLIDPPFRYRHTPGNH